MVNFGSFFRLCILVGVRKRLECREIGFPEAPQTGDALRLGGCDAIF